MGTTIRKATQNDLATILEIVNHSIQYSTAIYDYEPRNLEQQQIWFEEKQASNFPVLVAEMNNQVVGFGSYGTFRIKAAYQYTVEHSVYVSENQKGKGIGKKLLFHLIELARSEGYHTMIGCIDAENAGSIAFHEKFGFQSNGILKQVGYKFDRWLDLNLMQLLLK